MFILNFKIEMKHEKDKQISKKYHILPFSFFQKCS
jgi:hypothetical protein